MSAENGARDGTVRITIGRAGRKLLHVDRPAEAAAPPSVVGKAGGLIDLIVRAVCPDTTADRRAAPRHPVAEDSVWVGWWRGDDFDATTGRVRNVSRGGAEIVLDRKPPKTQSVWIYKEVGTTVASVRGEMVGHTPAPGGAFAVRFRFAAPCPAVLCQAMVCAKGKGRGAGRGVDA
jgi:hypothetical protein